MGDELTANSTGVPSSYQLDTMPLPPWLDAQSSALVRDIIITLAHHYSDLLAVVLFGSVARHDERALDDPMPSDVDLLAVFDADEDPVYLPRGLAITHTIGLARNRHLDAPREVQVMFATRSLREWDSTFLAGVVRDGMLLWARAPLPQPLRALGARSPQVADKHESAAGADSHHDMGELT